MKSRYEKNTCIHNRYSLPRDNDHRTNSQKDHAPATAPGREEHDLKAVPGTLMLPGRLPRERRERHRPQIPTSRPILPPVGRLLRRVDRLADLGPDWHDRLARYAAAFIALTRTRRVELMVGPAGSGKTYTAVRIAAWRAAGEGKVIGIATTSAGGTCCTRTGSRWRRTPLAHPGAS